MSAFAYLDCVDCMPDLQVQVSPDVVDWAIRRSGKTKQELMKPFPRLDGWLNRTHFPTLNTLERFANATHTPLGNFFLATPPTVDLGLVDFRTISNAAIAEPSPELIDTLALSEQRQNWYRSYAIENGFDEVEVVGCLSQTMTIGEAGFTLRQIVDFDPDTRVEIESLDYTWAALASVIEDIGVLVEKNGVVGNNTHRALNPVEFRGFALADEFAPLIFVNGVDFKAATVFTLAHELVHIALDISSISDFVFSEDSQARSLNHGSTEIWCSQVAAELLVPNEHLRDQFRPQAEIHGEIQRLSRIYKVSSLVLLHKVFDDGLINWHVFRSQYDSFRTGWPPPLAEKSSSNGGNTYNNLGVRVGRTFARALLADTRAGNTLYSDALRLLALKRGETINKFADHLGVG